MTDIKNQRPRKPKGSAAAKAPQPSAAESPTSDASEPMAAADGLTPEELELLPEAIRRDAFDEVISPEAYTHLRNGIRFYKQQRLAEAESEMVKAITMHPSLSPLYNIFGLLKIVRRAVDTLKQSVYTALTTDPDFMDEFVREGIQMLGEQRFDEAEDRFRKAINLNPRNTDARFRLGFTLISQRKYREAVEIFEELILLDPNNINAFFMLGIAYSELREYYPCISNLQHALRLQPAFVEARLTLADAYHHQGKYLISLRELDTLEKFIPDEDTTYLHRGMLLMELERYDEAIPHFERVIELKPQITEAYELLIGLYENRGHFAKGIEMAQRALLVNPEHREMQAAIVHLERRMDPTGQHQES